MFLPQPHALRSSFNDCLQRPSHTLKITQQADMTSVSVDTPTLDASIAFWELGSTCQHHSIPGSKGEIVISV